MFLLFRDSNLQPGSGPARKPKQRQKKSHGYEIKKTL
jgi:hypothetical protein